MRQTMEHLIGVAAQEGLTMRVFDNVHTNTIDAHRLLQFALETGGPALQRAQGGAALGVPAARRGRGRPHRADIAQARAYGVSGMPFFVIDKALGISGAQPVEVFTQALEQAWAEAHPVLQTVGGDADSCGPDGCVV